MSTTVDNRVVKMTFDSAQFEKNIANTIQALKELEKVLGLETASEGFSRLKNAADNLDLSIISSKLGKETDSISQLAVDASGSIEKIDDSANNVDFSNLSNGMTKEVDSISESSGDASKSIGAIGDSASTVDFSSISDSAYSMASAVGDAASSIDLSAINDNLEAPKEGFDAFGSIANGVLMGIGSNISTYVIDKLKGIAGAFNDFVFKPIKEGFGEYELLIGNVQTILANTGMDFDSDSDIQKVNDALDELNTYADQTIYKFNDMTTAVGTFTASGLDLDAAVNAVKGVSNVAAYSGASTTDVHRVLPQIAQALSSGTVQLMDWNSVQNANMASQGFVQALADMGAHMAEAGLVSNTDLTMHAAEAIKNGMTMRSSLQKEGFQGWLTSDILSETLQTFTYDTRTATATEIEEWRKHLEDLGYRDREEQDRIFELAAVATRSATEVRTWTQLWDTVGEAIGSNWAGIWRDMVGDFKQATDTFTFLSNSITAGIDSLFSGIKSMADDFNSSGAIEIIFGSFDKSTPELEAAGARIEGALDNIVNAIGKPLGAIREAFANVFGKEEGDEDSIKNDMVGFALAFKDFTASLVISDDMATGIRAFFEGVFSVVKVGITLITDFIGFIGHCIEVIRIFTDPLADIAATIAGGVGMILEWAANKILELRDAFVEAASPFGDIIEVIREFVQAFFEWADIPGKIDLVVNGLLNFLEAVWDFIDLPGKILLVGDAFRGALDFISNLTGWSSAVETVNKHFEETGEQLSVVDVWISQLMDTPIGSFLETIASGAKAVWDGFSSLAPHVEGLANAFGGFAERMKNAFLNWEPVKNIIDFIAGIPERITNAFNSLFGGGDKNDKGSIEEKINWIPNFFEDFSKRIDEATQYLENINAEQIITDIQTWGTNTLGAIKDFFMNLLDPEAIVKSIESSVDTITASIGNLLPNITSFFNGLFGTESTEALDGTLGGFAVATADVNPVVEWIESTYHGLTEGVQKIKDFVDPILEESNGWPDFIANLFDALKQKVIEKLGEFRDGIHEKIEAVKNLFTGNNEQGGIDFINDWFKNIQNTIGDWGETLKGALAEPLQKLFPEDWESILGRVDEIRNNLVSGLGGIQQEIISTMRESESLPDFIKNMFDLIKGHIEEALSGIWETIKSVIDRIQNFKPEDLMAGFLTVKDTIMNFVSEWMPDLQKVFDDGLNSIATFLSGATDGTWLDFGKNIFESIGKGVDEGVIWIKDKFLDISNIILGKLSEIPGGVGEIFANIQTGIEPARQYLDTAIQDLPNRFSNLVETLKTTLKPAIDVVVGFWKAISGQQDTEVSGGDTGAFTLGGVGPTDALDGSGLDNNNTNQTVDIFTTYALNLNRIMTAAKDFYDNHLAPFVDFAKEKFADLNLGEILEFIKDKLKDLDIQSILDILKGIIEGKLLLDISNFIGSIGDLTEDIAGGINNISIGIKKYLTTKNKKSISDAIKDLAEAIAIVGLVVAGLSLIPEPEKGIEALVSIATIITAMTAISGILEKTGFGGGGDDMLKAALSLGAFAASMIAVCFSIEALTKFDWAHNVTGIIAMVAALGVFGIFMGVVARIGGKGNGHGVDPISAAVGIGAFALAMLAILPSIEEFTNYMANLKEDKFQQAAIGLGVLGAAIAAMGWGLGQIGEHGLGAGIAVLALAGAMTIMSNAIENLAALDLLSMGLSLGALMVPLVAFYKFVKDLGALDLVVTSVGIIAFAGAITIIANAIHSLVDMSWDQIGAATVGIAALLYVFGLDVEKTGAFDFVGTAAGLIVFGGALIVIAEAIKLLSEMSWDQIGAATLGISALLFVFGVGVEKTEALDLAGSAAGLIVFGAALVVIAEAIRMLSDINWEAIGVAVVALGVLIGVFDVSANTTKGVDLATTAGSMILYAGALIMIAEAITMLSSINWEAITTASVALGALIAVFDVSANVTNGVDLATTAGSMILFGASLIIIGEAITMLSSINWEAITTASVALGALIAVFDVSAVATNGVDLATTAGSMILFGGALVIMSEALSNISQLDSESLQANATVMGIMVGAFAGLSALTGSVDLIATAAGIGAFALALGALGLAISTFPSDQVSTLVSNIIAGIGTGILEGVTQVIEKLPEVKQRILDALCELFGINSPSQVMADEVGQYLPAGIGQGILDGESGLSDTLSTLLNNLIETVKTWVETDAIPMLSQAASDIWNWLETEGLPQLSKFIDENMKRLGEFVEKVGQWLETDGLPLLERLAGDFWKWCQETGFPKLKEFIDGLMEKLGKLLEDLGIWMRDEGLPMLSELLGKFWDWCVTTGFPKLAEFVAGIFVELDKLLTQLGTWVMEEGIPAVADAVGDMVDSAMTAIGDWITNLPTELANMIAGVWDNIVSVGASILDGLASGITGNTDVLSSAINGNSGIVNTTLTEFQTGFDINSPSKLIRDEVGAPIDEGLADGITENGEMVTQAAYNVGNTIASGFFSGYEDNLKAIQEKYYGYTNDKKYGTDGTIRYGPNGVKSPLEGEGIYVNLDFTDENWWRKDQYYVEKAMANWDYSGLSAQMSSMIGSAVDISPVVEAVKYATESVLNGLLDQTSQVSESIGMSMSNEFASLEGAIKSGSNIYMDTGALVGAIAPQMDQALGVSQIASQRGV